MGSLFDSYNFPENCVRLPYTVNAKRCLREINSIDKKHYNDLVRSSTHTGVDSVFLRGFAPVHRAPSVDRPALASLKYIRSLLNEILPGKVATCLVAVLRPNSYIPVHVDSDPPGITTFRDTLRLHMPITTNKQTYFFCDDKFYKMQPGEIWVLNNFADHGVMNDHPKNSRIHIIADIYPSSDFSASPGKLDTVPGFVDEAVYARFAEYH